MQPGTPASPHAAASTLGTLSTAPTSDGNVSSKGAASDNGHLLAAPPVPAGAAPPVTAEPPPAAVEAAVRPARARPSRQRAKFSIRTFTSLADPNYRWFFLSLFAHFASMNSQMFIRGYLVFELTGSYAMLGAMSLANAIPGLLFSLLGGVVADRVPQKKHVVQVCQVIGSMNAGAIGMLLLMGDLRVEHLLIAAVVQGASNSMMMPARQALTNEVVGFDRLMNALALNNAGMNVARLMMPTFAGFVLAALGPGFGTEGAEWVYFLMTGLYLVSMLTLFMVRNDYRREPVSTPFSAVFSELKDGLAYIRRTPTIRMLLIVNVLVVMGSMPYFMLLPGFAREVLGAGPSGLGVLMSIQGVGSLAGSLVIASLPNKRRGLILLCSAFSLGCALVLFAWSEWFMLTAMVMTAVGLGQAGRMSLSQVLVQSYTADEYRGRVLSIYMMEMSLVQFGTFLVALLANVIGPQLAIGGTAVGLIALTVYLYLFVPQFRHLD